MDEIRQIKDKGAVDGGGGSVKSENTSLHSQRAGIVGRTCLGLTTRSAAEADENLITSSDAFKRKFREELRCVTRARNERIARRIPKWVLKAADARAATGPFGGDVRADAADGGNDAQRVVGDPRKTTVLPAATPRINNAESALFSRIDNAVLIEVDPEIIVVADHGHRVPTRVNPDGLSHGPTDERVVVRSGRIVGDRAELPAIDVRCEDYESTVGEGGLQAGESCRRVEGRELVTGSHPVRNRTSPRR